VHGTSFVQVSVQRSLFLQKASSASRCVCEVGSTGERARKFYRDALLVEAAAWRSRGDDVLEALAKVDAVAVEG
jgi:hypothetical protein